MKTEFLQVRFLSNDLRRLLAPKGVQGITLRPVLSNDFRPINLTAEATYLRGSRPHSGKDVIKGIPTNAVNDYFQFYTDFFGCTEDSNLDSAFFFKGQLEMAFSYHEKYFLLSGTKVNYGNEGITTGEFFTFKGEPNSKRMQELIKEVEIEEQPDLSRLVNDLKRDLARAVRETRVVNSALRSPITPSSSLQSEEQTIEPMSLEGGNSVTLLAVHCPPTWDGF